MEENNTVGYFDFFAFPLDVLVDLFNRNDRTAIVQVSSLNKRFKNEFDKEDGLWQRLTLKIFGWTTQEAKTKLQGRNSIDWRKEYRVAAFYSAKVTGNKLVATKGKNAQNFVTASSSWELYPHPIGDFSTAYYEFRLMGTDKFGVLCYGAALHGFDNALPGMGRNSFGYCSDGMIHLECETSPEDVPSFGNGDLVGFGINFAKKSIFFTKNGKMIKESSTNAHGHQLKNLKNLYATISKLKSKALDANFGAKPFGFDLLAYLQNPKSDQVKLFSEIIRDQLVTLSESETFLDYRTFEKPYLTLEFYPPKFDKFKLNPFLYTLTFLKVPPGVTSWVTDEVLELFLAVHGIMDAQKMLPSMQNSARIQYGMQDIMRSFGLKNKGKSWTQICGDVHLACFKFYCMVAYRLAHEMKEVIMKHAFEGEEQWAFKIARLLTLGDEKLNTFNFIVDAAIAAGDPIPGLENPTYGEAFSMLNFSIPEMRIEAIRQIVVQKLEHVMVPMKIKDLEKALKIFGADDEPLQKFYQTMKTYPHKERRIEKFMSLIMKSLLLRSVLTLPILYGVHVMKIPPAKFNTRPRFIAEMHKRLDKLITEPLKKEYLRHTLTELKTIPDSDLREYSLILIIIFGLKFDKNNEDMTKYREKMENLIKRKLGMATSGELNEGDDFGQVEGYYFMPSENNTNNNTTSNNNANNEDIEVHPKSLLPATSMEDVD